MNLEDLTPAEDKLKHNYWGTLASVVYIPTILLDIDPLYALGICVIIAAGKEIYDKKTKKGKPELKDFLFTMLTPVIIYLCLLASTHAQ